MPDVRGGLHGRAAEVDRRPARARAGRSRGPRGWRCRTGAGSPGPGYRRRSTCGASASAAVTTRAVAIAAQPLPAAGEAEAVGRRRRTPTPARRTAAAQAASASARRGPSRGRLPSTCTATLPISKPASRTRRAASARRRHPRRRPTRVGRAELRPRSPRPAARAGRRSRRGRRRRRPSARRGRRLARPLQAGQPQRTGAVRRVPVHVDADPDPRQEVHVARWCQTARRMSGLSAASLAREPELCRLKTSSAAPGNDDFRRQSSRHRARCRAERRRWLNRGSARSGR